MTTTDPSRPAPDLRLVRFLTAVDAGTFDEIRGDDGPGRPPAEQAETVADLVGTYARMADELAAMVEAEAKRSAAAYAGLAATLGQLHTELDELAAQIARGEC
ncbi:MAG: hypothetical protein ACRDRK_01925 [Pseudonocardia sp.]